MKYFFDTEFLEGTQKGFFSDSKPTIDLISIGIIAEDGREYYAISRDFNLKEAWNRWEQRTGEGDRNNSEPRKYWVRDNVLLPVFADLLKTYHDFLDKGIRMGVPMSVKNVNEFNFNNLRWLLKRFGMSNDKIARQVFLFVNKPIIDKYDDKMSFADEIVRDAYLYNKNIEENHEFYAYYSAYDWVGLCWLYGKMIDLPHGFPMYCNDLKQALNEVLNQKKWYIDGELYTLTQKLDLIKKHHDYPVNVNNHNALSDAKWNRKFYTFINKL